MAAEEEKILSIKVDYAEAIKAIADYQSKIDELKDSEKELKQQFKDGVISQQEYREGMAASKIQTQQYNEAIRVLNKEVNNSIKSDKMKDTSLKGLRAALSNLTAEYDSLSREEREAAKGKELQKHINEITDELKEAEEGTGRFYRNVGNYLNSLKGAFGNTTQAVVGFGQQLKLLATNPVILIIGAVAAAFNGIAKAIQSSEEQTNRWRVALAPLNAILDMVVNTLTEMAAWILNIVEGAGKLFGKVIELVGAETKLGQVMTEVNNKMIERAEFEKRQQDFTKMTRDEIVKTAKREREISDLRAKVAEKDKYSAKERLDMLDKVIALETEQARRNKEIAQERFEILKEEASFTENDAEMNNKLAEAEAAVIKADTDLMNKRRELNAQRAETVAQMNSEIEAAEKEAYAKIKAATIEQLGISSSEFDKLLKQQEKLNLAKLAGVKSTEELIKSIRVQSIEDRRREVEEEIAIEQMKYNAISTITGGLIELVTEIGEVNKAAAVASKVLALAQIAIDTGVAISTGIKSAMGVPFPGNLAAIATTIATVLANITTAIKTVKSAKFATGGDVTGEGTATSDSIPAMLSNGESVMTAKATSMFAPILSAFNQAGGGVPIYGQQMGNQAMGEDMLAKSFAKGLANMPAPVVSVEEISTVTNRVKVIENINRI